MWTRLQTWRGVKDSGCSNCTHVYFHSGNTRLQQQHRTCSPVGDARKAPCGPHSSACSGLWLRISICKNSSSCTLKICANVILSKKKFTLKTVSLTILN